MKCLEPEWANQKQIISQVISGVIPRHILGQVYMYLQCSVRGILGYTSFKWYTYKCWAYVLGQVDLKMSKVV